MKRILGSMVLAALVGIGAVGCDTAAAKSPAPTPMTANGSDQTGSTVEVTVDGKGYTPSRINLKKGKLATLRFTRTTDETCAKEVVFPELKIEKKLPLNKAVDIPFPTDKAGTFAFHCGMGMYKSSVVID